MGTIVELPPIKLRSSNRRQGLRKLSPDLVSKARDETATQVTRVGLTFLGTAAFCLLSLLSPDSALLGGSEKINVPFAGPVSFFGFMLLGPAVLIVLRVYLQIYVEHSDRLDRLARSMSAVRAPTLVPLQNSLLRLFSGLTFWVLLPVAMLLFAWKAAVFPAWGAGLLAVAVAIIVGHFMLRWFSRFSWRSRGLLSAGAAMIAVGVMLRFGPPHRPFNLFQANLSGQSLLGEDLSEANLRLANLREANLTGTNLRNAYLIEATLSGANLSHANLTDAEVGYANLSGANLSHANLTDAKLIGANLSGANLSGSNLSGAKLSGANLSGANLSRAELIGAHLSGAELRGADLSSAELRGAHLSGANLSGTNLSGTNLIRAELRGAELSGANLSGANLSGARLIDANLSRANLGYSNLRGAELRGADLSLAEDLTQTHLDEACGNNYTKLPEGLTLKPCRPD